MARLVLRDVVEGWRAWELPGGELVLGRDDDCALAVRERSISRRHARLVARPEGWCVYDEGSGNGTFVNGHRVREALLRDGDEVRFGNVRGRFEEPERAAAAVPAAAPAPARAAPPPPPAAAVARRAQVPLPPASPGPVPPPLPAAPPPVHRGARTARPPAPRPPRAPGRRSALPAVLAAAVLGLAAAVGAGLLLWRGFGPAGARTAGTTRGARALPAAEDRLPLDAGAAVEAGDAARLDELLAGGADPNAAGDDGLTLAQRAAWAGNAHAARLLAGKGADLLRRDPLGLTPAERALSEGRCEAALALLPKEPGPPGDGGRTLLHRAAGGGCVEAVRELLSREAAVDAPDAAGLTPLHVSALAGHAEVVTLLLGKGASPSATTSAGRTPLHLAALGGRAGAARALLSKGADPNARDSGGRTSLHLAAAAGDAETLSTLLAARADPTLAGPDGTALDVALEAGAWEGAELLAPPG